MKGRTIKILGLWLILTGSVVAGSGNNLRELMSPPKDTVLAEQVRLWLGIEKRPRCPVAIEICDDSGRVVRHLLDRTLPLGYYNFYWDRKDDSGYWVPGGEYIAHVDVCGSPKEVSLTAAFKPGEELCLLHSEEPDRLGVVSFELLQDSTVVSILVMAYVADRVIDRPVVDSVMARGRHVYQWVPPSWVKTGNYRLGVKTGDFVHKTVVRYRR
jgi:hypothetical protein